MLSAILGMYKFEPRYGVTGDALGNWTVDIFWGSGNVEHVKTFEPGKISLTRIREQSLVLNLTTSIVLDAFKSHESREAKERALKYMEQMRRDHPVRRRPEDK